MNKTELKQELQKLFKSMDYVSKKYLVNKKITPKSASLFYNIYQQLGFLWELLSYQCKHWDGYYQKDKKWLCKICGEVQGSKKQYYFLPVKGEKVIGRMVKPARSDKFQRLSKKQAEILNDTIKFHGVKLNVSVFNGYVSKLSGKEINIASDRLVTLEENDLLVDIGKFIAGVRIKGAGKPGPVYGGFLWELPRRLLKKMPIILSYNKRGKLTGLELLR